MIFSVKVVRKEKMDVIERFKEFYKSLSPDEQDSLELYFLREIIWREDAQFFLSLYLAQHNLELKEQPDDLISTLVYHFEDYMTAYESNYDLWNDAISDLIEQPHYGFSDLFVSKDEPAI